MNKWSRGTAMVELAIIMPFLLILVFGIAEMGRALYQEHILVKSAAVAARYMARAYGAVTIDEVAETCAKTATWSDQENEAKKLAVSAGGGLETTDVAVDVDFRKVTDAGTVWGLCVIEVSIVNVFDGIFGESLVPFIEIGPLTLNARSEEVYIGE